MRFSQIFGITRTDQDDWFDVFLHVDTELFIDPFLIFDSDHPKFVGAHDHVNKFFDSAFKLLAAGGRDKTNLSNLQAHSNLRLPEVEELCLGYVQTGTRGAGSDKGLAANMCDAILTAIDLGLENVEHFEEVCILRKFIGPDRISDATANILRPYLCDYTKSVCKAHGVPVNKVTFNRGRFIVDKDRWANLDAELPINPRNNSPILLVPQHFLRGQPTLGADEFTDFMVREYSDATKTDLNVNITREVSRDEILKIARERADIRARFIADQTQKGARPYDLESDPQLFVKWENAAQQYLAATPFKYRPPATEDEFFATIREMVKYFKHYIEEHGGWQLLWNDDKTARPEKAAQRLFYGVVYLACQNADINVDPEPNVGRGPVDFKFSKGCSLKVLVETKLANNTKWKHGIEKQLPTYLKADKTNCGFYVVIVLREKDDARLTEIEVITKEVSGELKMKIEVVGVDATPKQSASNA